jgi:hypothetical protein
MRAIETHAVAHMADGARSQKTDDEAAEVVDISRARDKAERRRAADAIGRFSPLQPFVQVVWLIGERAHIGNAHVEQRRGSGVE